MASTVSAAQAKATFASLIARVEHGDTPIVIERHGRPVAALVRVEDLPSCASKDTPHPPRGALALVGVGNDLENDEVDDMVREIYDQRDRDRVREVPALE